MIGTSQDGSELACMHSSNCNSSDKDRMLDSSHCCFPFRPQFPSVPLAGLLEILEADFVYQKSTSNPQEALVHPPPDTSVNTGQPYAATAPLPISQAACLLLLPSQCLGQDLGCASQTRVMWILACGIHVLWQQ